MKISKTKIQLNSSFIHVTRMFNVVKVSTQLHPSIHPSITAHTLHRISSAWGKFELFTLTFTPTGNLEKLIDLTCIYIWTMGAPRKGEMLFVICLTNGHIT